MLGALLGKESCRGKERGCDGISVKQGCQSQQIKTWNVTLKLVLKFNLVSFFF